MEVRFGTRKMQKACSSSNEAQRKWGDQNARKLRQRMAELTAAGTLEDIGRLPGPRCHELKGKRKGQLSVDLVHPYRLIFEPDHDPVPTKPGGGLDWSRIARVVVVEVVDTH